MRHAIHQRESTVTSDDLGAHHVAVDPWRVIQFLQQRRSEKLERTSQPDLDLKLVELLAKLKRRVRPTT
jgi:hypothetical protein